MHHPVILTFVFLVDGAVLLGDGQPVHIAAQRNAWASASATAQHRHDAGLAALLVHRIQPLHFTARSIWGIRAVIQG
jgi:hypothetical protein